MKTTELISLGKSGWPLVPDGARLTVTTPDSPRYGFGDLVVFCGAGIQICHRILRRKQQGALLWYLVKGDANLQADGWIPAYRVLGRVDRINGRSTRRFNVWLMSRALCLGSFVQWATHEVIFQSRVGQRMREFRERLWPRPLVVGAFRYLTAPWQLFQPGR